MKKIEKTCLNCLYLDKEPDKEIYICFLHNVKVKLKGNCTGWCKIER